MAKINVAKMAAPEELDDLISKISQFSNAQARVSKVDLRSRNPKLLKLKKLSDSVSTPTGERWFFIRAKGEFETMLRLNKSRQSHIKNQFPPKRRFTKELLAKYYSSWGDSPHLVKKGGEKIFRHFIEDISGETEGVAEAEINRDFYEAVVAKIILFRNMERIYGVRKSAMGQIRASVIPYSLAVLYSYSDADDTRGNFDLARIWKTQDLEDEFETPEETIAEVQSFVASIVDFTRLNAPPTVREVKRCASEGNGVASQLSILELAPGKIQTLLEGVAVSPSPRSLETGKGGQGFGLSHPERTAVEMRAMRVARSLYEQQGWEVVDKSGSHPFDLLATRKKEVRYIEVKGTTGSGDSIILNLDLFLEKDLVNGVSLREKVEELKKIVSLLYGDFSLILHGLRTLGITYENIGNYDNIRFRYLSTNTYNAVSDGFPKLVRSTLPSSIKSVKYTLVLQELADYLIPEGT